MEILLTVIGLVLGAAVTWVFSRRASRELRGARDDLLKAIGELSRSEVPTVAKEAIERLGIVEPERARELAARYEQGVAAERAAIENLPEGTRAQLKDASGVPTQACPTCGKPAAIAGWAAGPDGRAVWHYRCEQHGRFPGWAIEDLLE